jgi:hypothetical protein
MYEIRPESIKTFVEDKSIKLPRFQRKQTWKEKKNFALLISVFKKFPLGVIVVNKETAGRKVTKWLLDGRQRRNALIEIQLDPECLYVWGKNFIGFKSNDQLSDIEDKFWYKIEKHLGEEQSDDADQNELDQGVDTTEEGSEEESTIEEDINEELFIEDSKSSSKEIKENFTDLKVLLEFILLIHKKSKKDSGFTKPFDFTESIDRLNYVDNINGTKCLNSKKLKTWITGYRSNCSNNDENYSDENIFYKYLLSSYNLPDNLRLKTKVKRNWDKIKNVFEMIDTLELKLQETKIGFIELNNADASDAQTIFKIINTAGTPLTTPEILSAKPSWNIKIINPSQQLIDEVNILYQSIGVEQDDVVKWDIAATFLNRIIGMGFIFQNLDYNETSQFSKKITFGFKLISAIYQNGITKVNIDDLSDNNKISWDSDIDKVISDLNNIGRILLSNQFYEYFNSWNKSLMDLTSDAVSINFTILTYLDWKRKGEPVGNNTTTKKFVKNSIILFDKLIYEYLTKQWRGSSDSKIADNINGFSALPELHIPLGNSKWIDLLTEIFDHHKLNESPLKIDGIDQLLKPILYYYYTLRELAGPTGLGITVEQDHIIPVSTLNNSHLENISIKKNNLFNLALFPKKSNIKKGNKKLNEIQDSWLKSQIELYSEIPSNLFDKYSDVNNLDDLKEYRKEKFISIFKEKRDQVFNN